MSDYYVISRANNNHHPLFEWDQRSGMFYKGVPVEIEEPVKLRLGAPIPGKPKMVDYHSLPESVVSEKIWNVLEPMNIDGIQLVPAKVRGVNEGDVYDYWLIHIYNEIACMDRNLSVYSIDDSDGRIDDIARLVLDNGILNDIPLEERLVFELSEGSAMFLYHASVVTAVLSENPEGVTFTNVAEWNDGTAFE